MGESPLTDADIAEIERFTERPSECGIGDWVDWSRAMLAEVRRLRAAIAEHHGQKADDRCWMDDRKLYEAAGLPTESYDQIGSPSAMLKNCERFVTLRCSGGGPWKSYAELEAENADLRNKVAGFEHVQDLWNKGMESTCDSRDALKQEVRRLEADNAALRAALSPFAAAADDIKATDAEADTWPLFDAATDDDGYGPLSELTCGHLRAARAALRGKEPPCSAPP